MTRAWLPTHKKGLEHESLSVNVLFSVSYFYDFYLQGNDIICISLWSHVSWTCYLILRYNLLLGAIWFLYIYIYRRIRNMRIDQFSRFYLLLFSFFFFRLRDLGSNYSWYCIEQQCWPIFLYFLNDCVYCS